MTGFAAYHPSWTPPAFTGNNEWHTPVEWVEAAREVMGEIDLDPASNVIAQHKVKAMTYYTAENDGLTYRWHGRVWLNPPYARGLVDRFIDKLVIEYDAGRVVQAILLTHRFTDTGWFHHAASRATALFCPRGRIRFINSARERASPRQGQIFQYLGPHPLRFCKIFRQFDGIALLPPGQHTNRVLQ